MISDLARNLTLLRRERGISQKAAAEQLGVSQALLSHYENGVRRPGLEFVVKLCDFYNVSADFILGRTLSREGSMLTGEDILNMAEPNNVLRGSVLATLQSKLLGGAVGVLFGLLGRLGDKAAVNEAANVIGDDVYQLCRHLARAAGVDERGFALTKSGNEMDLAAADRKLAETRFVRALNACAENGMAFPSFDGADLKAEYPGRAQSLTQVLSTADSRLHALETD